MTLNWLFLIYIPIVVLIVVGPILIIKAQRRGLPGPAQPGPPTPAFQQAPQETREEFVRRNWNRSGVVANGETLVDLYDRIRALEARLAEAERK